MRRTHFRLVNDAHTAKILAKDKTKVWMHWPWHYYGPKHSIIQVLISPMLHTYHICIRILCTFTFCAYFSFNGLSNCQFACSLADFRQISTTETFGHLSQVLQVHILKKGKGNQINYNKLLFIWQGYPHLLLLLIPSYSWQFNAILIKQNSIPKSVS